MTPEDRKKHLGTIDLLRSLANGMDGEKGEFTRNLVKTWDPVLEVISDLESDLDRANAEIERLKTLTQPLDIMAENAELKEKLQQLQKRLDMQLEAWKLSEEKFVTEREARLVAENAELKKTLKEIASLDICNPELCATGEFIVVKARKAIRQDSINQQGEK